MLTAVRRNRTRGSKVELGNELTFTALESVDISLTIPAAIDTTALEYVEYSLNGGKTWVRTNNSSSQVVITLPTLQTGQRAQFRGKGTHYGSSTEEDSSKFQIHGYTNVSGNFMSLIEPVYFDDLLIAPNYCFAYLFKLASDVNNHGIKNVPSLTATTVGDGAYMNMFAYCRGIISVDEMKATVLGNQACYRMFYTCDTIRAYNGALKATVVGTECFKEMFKYSGVLDLAWPTQVGTASTVMKTECCAGMFTSCSSMTTPPLLPATSLQSKCYSEMFMGCKGLTVAPVLPATTLAQYCYQQMFNDCISLQETANMSATTLAMVCCYAMYYGCTNLKKAVLPALTLYHSCYMSMFQGCTKLDDITMLATTIGERSLSAWVNGVANEGIFVKNAAMTTLPTGDNGIPTGWTVEDYVE